MSSRAVSIYVNGYFFRRWAVPNHIGYVNIRVFENCPVLCRRQISDEIQNPRAKMFTADISKHNEAFFESDEIEFVEGLPYLKKCTASN